MSVESEIEALRDDVRESREDVRGMRAAFDSFIKTFQTDVMSRLATLEQWKLTHGVEFSKAQEKLESVQRELTPLAGLPEVTTTVKALKEQNDRQQGSINAMRVVGGLAVTILGVAEILLHLFGKGR